MQSLKYSLFLIFQNQNIPKRPAHACLRTLNNKGFTIVETIFSTFIGVVILGMVSILYVMANNNMTMGLALAEINSDSRLSMDRIIRDVRWGTQIVTNRTVSSTNYVTGDDELIIEIPSIDTNGDVIASTYDYVIYSLDPSDSTLLRKIVDPDVASNRGSLNQIIADNISSFALGSGGTDLGSVGSLSSVTSLEIALTVNKQPLLNKTVTETINSEVELRNN